MSKSINGNEIAEKIIKKAEKRIKKDCLKLKMVVVLIGDDPVSLSYISQKKKYAEKAGVEFSLYQFSKKIKEKDLTKEIEKISKSCSGVIIQLPLPVNLETQKVLDVVPQKKDIDLLSTQSLGKFYGQDFSILPPVVQAIKIVLNENKISVKQKNISIIGFGRLIGKPLSFWLASSGATISIINESTKNPSFFTKKADVLISGVGKAGLIKGNMVKERVIAIDAGSSFSKGKIKGDFNESIQKKASLYAPVPGGIGPITTACLIQNLIKMQNL